MLMRLPMSGPSLIERAAEFGDNLTASSLPEQKRFNEAVTKRRLKLTELEAARADLSAVAKASGDEQSPQLQAAVEKVRLAEQAHKLASVEQAEARATWGAAFETKINGLVRERRDVLSDAAEVMEDITSSLLSLYGYAAQHQLPIGRALHEAVLMRDGARALRALANLASQ